MLSCFARGSAACTGRAGCECFARSCSSSSSPLRSWFALLLLLAAFLSFSSCIIAHTYSPNSKLANDINEASATITLYGSYSSKNPLVSRELRKPAREATPRHRNVTWRALDDCCLAASVREIFMLAGHTNPKNDSIKITDKLYVMMPGYMRICREEVSWPVAARTRTISPPKWSLNIPAINLQMSIPLSPTAKSSPAVEFVRPY
mmetsp:Transcript_31550/g.55509  ORF Transcript_31550/g.55509 Transcript_31550/m.55509 type:complete len:205 (+) Transcript_31550:991-1605(+)